jgi:hypothetical protein
MSLRPISVSLLVGIFLAPFLLNRLNAQTTTSGGVTGVVTDQTGAVVPHADVEIRDVDKGTTESTKTDRDGVYRFFFLSPSQYTLTVEHDRFRKESRSVTVLLETPVTVNITLEIAKANIQLVVTAEAPLVQADNGDVSITMSQTQVSELPNPGNDLTYIAQTAPGAIMATDNARTGGVGGNFSILGMPGTSNLFTLNGMNDNSGHLNFTGATGMLLGQNQIQEATVVSNGYSGHFGDAPGSYVNYVTKSGGNEFHGNAKYFWNGSVLNATDWITEAFGNPRPFDIANQWAASVGGPIQKNRLFFFFDTEGLRVLLPSPVQVVLPSPQFEAATIANIDSIFGSASASDAFYKQIFSLYNQTPGIAAAAPGSFSNPLGCLDASGGFIGPQTGQVQLGVNLPCAIHFQTTLGQPTSESLVSGRMDWNVRTNDRAFFLLQYDNGRQPIVVDPISSVFNVYYSGPWWQAQLNETHTLGTTSANQFLLAGIYQDGVTSVVNPAQTLAAFPTTLDWSDAGGPFTQLGGFDYIYGYPIGRGLTQYEIADDFLKIRGKHKFGFGLDFLRAYLSNSDYTQNAVGDTAPQTIDAFYSGGVDPAHPQNDSTRLRQSFATQLAQRFASYTLAGYGQDEWKVKSNLTLTLALRAEHESNPVCAHDCFAELSGPFESISHDSAQPYNQAISKREQAFFHKDAVDWAPRFSFAWQPLGVSHNTVVRGGLGLFYELVGGFATYFSVNPPLVNRVSVFGPYNLAPEETNSLFKVAAASNAAFVEGFAAGENLAQINTSDPHFFPPSIIVAINHPRSPQYQKWSLEVQQTLGTNTSVTFGYYGNHGIHEFVQNPSANASGFGPFPATVCASPPVPPCADPRFSGVTEYGTPGISNYNGMVVSFRRRFTGFGNGLFQVNYTYGHALDEVSNGGLAQFAAGSSEIPQDPFNLRGSYGAADYDVRHSLNANYVWQLPVKTVLHGRSPDYLVRGWQVSGTIFARTGFPYTVIDLAESRNLASKNFYGTIYSVPVAPLSGSHSCGAGAVIPPFPHPCWPPQVVTLPDGTTTANTHADFVQTGCETGFNTGNLPNSLGACSGAAVSFAQGRNRFRYPSYFNTDFTVMKKTSLVGQDKVVLGIGVQFFNFFNHPNFGPPDNDSSDPSFGEISTMEMPPTSILGSGLGGDVSPRMIQLKAQIRF